MGPFKHIPHLCKKSPEQVISHDLGSRLGDMSQDSGSNRVRNISGPSLRLRRWPQRRSPVIAPPTRRGEARQLPEQPMGLAAYSKERNGTIDAPAPTNSDRVPGAAAFHESVK